MLILYIQIAKVAWWALGLEDLSEIESTYDDPDLETIQDAGRKSAPRAEGWTVVPDMSLRMPRVQS